MNIQTAVSCFSNLGHQRRLEIIKLLVKSAPQGLTMNEIGSKTQIPNSTLTHHIRFLEDTSLVIRQHEAQSIRCLINIELIKELSQFLLDECCIDTAQPCC